MRKRPKSAQYVAGNGGEKTAGFGIKAVLLFLLAVLLFLFMPLSASAAEMQDISSNLDLSFIDDYINDLEGELSGYMTSFTLKGIWNDIRSGKIGLNLQGLATVLGRVFFKEVAASAKLLLQLIILSLVCLMLNNLAAAFGNGNISNLAHGVTYLLLIGIAVGSFSMALSEARLAVTSDRKSTRLNSSH